MKVRYSPRATRDLGAIADYVRQRSPSGARAVESKIRSTAELLGRFPESGRRVDQRSSARVMPLGRYPYIVFYTLEADELVILHIRHGARAPIGADDL